MHAFTDAAAAAVPDLSAHAAAELAWGVARCDRSPGRVHARGFAGRLAAAGLHGAAAVAVSAMGGGNGGSLPVGASPKLSMLRATRGPKTLNSNIISSGGGGGRNNNSDPFRGGFKNILSGERDDAAAPAAATPAAAAAAAASPAGDGPALPLVQASAACCGTSISEGVTMIFIYSAILFLVN